MPTSETGLQQAIQKAVRKHYPKAWIMKVHGSIYQKVGVPDLLIVVHGVLIGAEVKFVRPGESEDHARGRATPEQRRQIAEIIEAGGMAGVVISVEETLDLIERGIRKQRKAQRERAV